MMIQPFSAHSPHHSSIAKIFQLPRSASLFFFPNVHFRQNLSEYNNKNGTMKTAELSHDFAAEFIIIIYKVYK